MSPGNSEGEMEEKAALYFDAGAKEVWICSEGGVMKFTGRGSKRALRQSQICPKFPRRVELP